MNRLTIVTALAVWLACLCSVPAQILSKDTRVRYRNAAGKEETVAGQIRKETLAEFVIKPTTGPERKIPVTRLIEVEYAAPSSTTSIELRAARTRETEGKFAQAIKHYQDLLPKLPDSPLKRHAEFTIARLTARLAEDDRAQGKRAVTLLQEFKKKNPNAWQLATYPALLAPLQVREGDAAGAQQTLAELAALPGIPADLRLECSVLAARLLCADKKFAEAQKKLQALLKGLPADDAQTLRLRVALAECQAAAGKPAEAAKELEALAARSNDAEFKACAYNALGDCYRQTGDTRKAMWKYLYVDTLYPQNREEHARALYHLYQVFKALKDDKKARQCRETLENDKQLAGKYQSLIRQEK